MSLHKKKYEQIIVYLCQKLGGDLKGKKKLAKLLYFVDFDFFEKYQTLFTGDTYKALPMGPFPISLDLIVAEMAKKKLLVVKKVSERNGYIPTEVYHCLAKIDESVFSREEKKVLERVVNKYGQLNGKQLEDLTHNEAPYIGVELKAEIPYELSFYRGTDFSDL